MNKHKSDLREHRPWLKCNGCIFYCEYRKYMQFAKCCLHRQSHWGEDLPPKEGETDPWADCGDFEARADWLDKWPRMEG